MSVLIKGMKMPKGCAFCKIPTRNGKKMLCPLMRREWDLRDPMSADHRLDGCPLIELPPHGLIAREQILDAIRIELAQANAVNDMEDYDSWARVFDYVRKFPAIIEAEGE